MEHGSRPSPDDRSEQEGLPPDRGDEHDLGLIIERLNWTPEQRLDANAAFLRFYLSVRPQGPLLPGE